jgi:hypothetical protein
MQIQTIEPPVVADEANGIKGRASYRVTLADGTRCYAGDQMGAELVEGTEYTNLEMKEGNYGNVWLNWAKGNGGGNPVAPPTPQQAAPKAAPAQQSPKQPAKDATPANIFLQGMLQQAIASGVHDPVAVWGWALANYPNFRDRKPMTAFPGNEPTLAPHVPATGAPQVPEPTGETLDDSIPF